MINFEFFFYNFCFLLEYSRINFFKYFYICRLLRWGVGDGLIFKYFIIIMEMIILLFGIIDK
jgi:hypothetical protein